MLKDIPNKLDSRKELEHLFNIDLQNKSLLLTVGRQVKRKGHEWFITEVFPKINSDVVYIAIGEGPEHSRLIEVQKELPHKNKINFCWKTA